MGIEIDKYDLETFIFNLILHSFDNFKNINLPPLNHLTDNLQVIVALSCFLPPGEGAMKYVGKNRDKIIHTEPLSKESYWA